MSNAAHITAQSLGNWLLLVALVLSLNGATGASTIDAIRSGTDDTTTPLASAFHRGEGSVIFTAHTPLADKPVTLFYYIPEQGDLRRMPVLFTLHGAQRTSAPNLDSWRAFAERRGFIILAPQYSKEIYDENDYQFGGVLKSVQSRETAPPEQWTYAGVEAMFDFFKRATGNTSATYDMFGHSAGGQFVHRFLLATPGARVRRAVAANPGSWTFPLADGLPDGTGRVHGWPYSAKDTPFADAAHLRAFFARNLVVQLGTDDTATEGKFVTKAPGALAQGANRHARGLAFFRRSQDTARAMNVPFNWKLVEVPGVGHAGKSMVFGKKTTANDPDATLPCGAYHLLFGE